MAESQRQAADIEGIAAKQSNAITQFRQRDTAFLSSFPLDVASAENLILSGVLTAAEDASIAPAETLLDAAFAGENNHLDGQSLALGVDAVLYMEQILMAPQERYAGRSILQILSGITR